jgi:hypothetical protein
LDDYFERLLDFAVAADWGKHPFPNPRAAALATSGQHPGPEPGPAVRHRKIANGETLIRPEPTAARRGER